MKQKGLSWGLPHRKPQEQPNPILAGGGGGGGALNRKEEKKGNYFIMGG
jgi:hypothetical protein